MHAELTLIGYLGKEPELRYTPGGQAVTVLSVATSRTWTDGDGERQQETTWWRVSVWGKSGENAANYLHKGSKAFIQGRMNPDPKTGGPRLWTAQDGTVRASFEVTAALVKYLDSKSDRDGRGEEIHTAEVGEEEMPF